VKTTVSEPESWKRVIEIEVPESEVDTAVDAKLRELRRDVRMPGFRQGKVPMAVVRQRFGKSARAEAVEAIMQDAFKIVCEEHKINPVGEAKLADMKGEAGETLRFIIEAEVDPPAEITGYGNLKIKAKPVKVTDSMVDKAFDDFIDRYAAFYEVERPAKKGDYIRIRYKNVSIDGAERPDLKEHCPEYPIELGGEGVLKEFDRGLIGKSAGNETEIGVDFPKDYGDAGVAGTRGEFAIEVLAVLEKHPPKLDEEFLSQFGQNMTVEALRSELRKNLEANELRKVREEAHTEAIQALIKNNRIELAPSNIDMLAKSLFNESLKERNLAETVPTDEQLAVYREMAVMLLKRIKIINYVADKERIGVTQEEVDREIMLTAQGYGQDFDALKRHFKSNGVMDRIWADIRERKTLDFLTGEGGLD
jgi:trigger factor